MDKWRILHTIIQQNAKRASADHDEVLERHYHTWAVELKGMAKAFAEVLMLMDQLEANDDEQVG